MNKKQKQHQTIVPGSPLAVNVVGNQREDVSFALKSWKRKVKASGILEKTKFDKLISFSPNPTSNELILQSSIADKISYSVNDITGREILKGEFSGNKKLDVSILSKGTYFIKFELNGFNTTKKLLIAD